MTTEITVFAGDADLVNRAKAQGQANRFARIENEQQAKTEQAAGELLQLNVRWNSIALSRLGGRMFRHLFFSEEPIARRNASTGLLAFLLVPTEGFDNSIIGPFGDPTGAPYTSYGASPGLVLGYTNTYWTVTNWRKYFGYAVVGGVWQNVGRLVFEPLRFDEIDEISQQILPPVFQNVLPTGPILKGQILKSKRYIDSGSSFFSDPWMERTIAEVHLAHAVAARTNFCYRYDTSQERLEYQDNTPLSMQLGSRNAMTLEFIVQLGVNTLKADGGTLKFDANGLPYTEMMGINRLELRLEGYSSGVWGQGAYDKFDLFLQQGHGFDGNSSNLVNFVGGQSVGNDPTSGDFDQYAENERRENLWRPDYDYDDLGTKTLVTINDASFKTEETLAARPVHCALVFTNDQTRFYVDGSLGYTSPPAPRMLSAQTMRLVLSLRDSAYKEYATISDYADDDTASVTANADFFGHIYPRSHFINIVEVQENYFWAENYPAPGINDYSSSVTDHVGYVQIIPDRSLNGVPCADPGALSSSDRAKLVNRYLYKYKIIKDDLSIWGREGINTNLTPSGGEVNEAAAYQRYEFYDQYGVEIAHNYATLNLEYHGYAYDQILDIHMGTTGRVKRWCQKIVFIQQRLNNSQPIPNVEHEYNRVGELLDLPVLTDQVINPRSTIFNGPSSISGIRLTSQELYTGTTVQVPSAITSLDPENDNLITPPGPGNNGGGNDNGGAS